MLKGLRCREPLPGVTKINKAAIAYADNKRRAILTEIKEGRFEYLMHFPDSPRAARLTRADGQNPNRTVKEGVDRWMEVQYAKKATSTSRNYAHKAKHVLNWGAPQRIADISKSDLELFQAKLLRSGLSPKTVNDVFTVVRGVWADAYSDGLLKANPLDRIKNIERDQDEDFADPFTRDIVMAVGVPNTQVLAKLDSCEWGCSLLDPRRLRWSAGKCRSYFIALPTQRHRFTRVEAASAVTLPWSSLHFRDAHIGSDAEGLAHSGQRGRLTQVDHLLHGQKTHYTAGEAVCPVEPVDGSQPFTGRCRRGQPVKRSLGSE